MGVHRNPYRRALPHVALLCAVLGWPFAKGCTPGTDRDAPSPGGARGQSATSVPARIARVVRDPNTEWVEQARVLMARLAEQEQKVNEDRNTQKTWWRREVLHTLWDLSLLTGYLPDHAFASDSPETELAQIIAEYERHLHASRNIDVSVLQLDGLARAVELTRTDSWPLGMRYVFSKVCFDRLFAPPGPFGVDPVLSKEERQEMHAVLDKWLVSVRDRLKWERTRYAGGRFVLSDGSRVPSRPLTRAIRLWRRQSGE